MDRRGNKYESKFDRPAAEPITRSNNLAVLGESPAESPSAIHPQISPAPARPQGRIAVTGVLRLLEWQRFRCALTGRKLTPETASLDHIVPVRCGGMHELQNVQALHKDVNRAKSTMTNDEFVQLCREVVRYSV